MGFYLSAVVALLTRQYALQEPTSAHSNIFVGSYPLASIRLSTLRSCIGLVGQDPQVCASIASDPYPCAISLIHDSKQLFSGTILENVAVGLTGTPDELLEDGSNRKTVEALCRYALEKAQALSFVEMLPSGLDERITAGKTGVLSGGQRQRSESRIVVCVEPFGEFEMAVELNNRCRKILQSRLPELSSEIPEFSSLASLSSCCTADSRSLNLMILDMLVLIDEGTSALDSETEQNLMDSVMREQSERHMTVILIAHRVHPSLVALIFLDRPPSR